jgi:hypothetical protein
MAIFQLAVTPTDFYSYRHYGIVNFFVLISMVRLAALSHVSIGEACMIMPATVTQNSTCLGHLGWRDKK